MNQEQIELQESRAYLEEAYKDLWHEVDVKVETAFAEGFKRGQKATYIHEHYTEYWLKSDVRARLKETECIKDD